MPALIDFTPYTAAKNHFEGNPDLCALFKLLATETWKRIEFTYIKPYIKVYETTLTQNIAFTVNAYKEVYPLLPIDVWEAADENANGNDLELIINFGGRPFCFYAAVQAKKIYRGGGYNAIDHGDQVLNLIEYAESLNGVPLYLLYNSVERLPRNIPATDKTYYGCTIIDAYHFRDNYYDRRTVRKRDGTLENRWLIPQFSGLHPAPAFPWHFLVCGNTPEDLFNRFSGLPFSSRISTPISAMRGGGLISADLSNIPGFVSSDIITYNGWLKSSDKEILGETKRLRRYTQHSNLKERKDIFNPKTRFVVTIGGEPKDKNSKMKR